MPYDPSRHGPRRVVGPGFHEWVFEVVARVPEGMVTTYGDVAEVLGLRRAARQVGFALAALPPTRRDVPWYRVVNGRGRLSTADGRQRALLAAEGVEVDDEGRLTGFARIRAPLDLLRGPSGSAR